MEKVKKIGFIVLVVLGTLGALALAAPESIKSKFRV